MDHTSTRINPNDYVDLRVTDAFGNQTAYCYDACDRLIEIRQYDECGETAAVGNKAKGINEDLTISEG